MYHPSVTERAVDAANAAQWQAAKAKGLPTYALEYHTEAQIAQAVSYYNGLWDTEQNKLVRALSGEEQQFIDNERTLCALDFDYYRKYARIISWNKESIPFVPNVAQSMVITLWGELEARALAISMMQLKARQLGVSTLTEIAVAQRVQFVPRTNAVVASADPQKSRKMAKMIEYNYEQMPWWLMPVATVNNQTVREFGEIHTSLLIQAGNQFTGVARGDTPNVAHLSELCEWPDPEDLVDASLMRAMHDTPDIFLVLESTALGRGNWWHKKWKLSKSEWSKGRARLCPVFLPWFTGTDIYPTPTWLRGRAHLLNEWQPEDNTIRHAERARAYVLANPLLFDHLAHGDKDWQMPREQMLYYEIERDAAIASNQLNKFLSEMPADDMEAFQSSNISSIKAEIILNYRESVQDPLGVYTIVGPHIAAEHVVSRREWDFDKPVIIVKAQQLLPRCNDIWQFIPLRFHGYSDTDPMLRLFIFEEPEQDETYGLGVDTADGLGLDRSVIEVMRRDSPTRIDGQCAEFASDYIRANQLWPMSLAIACYYSPYQAHLQKRAHARAAIECKGNGEVVQLEMKKRGWTNFHPWLRYDNRQLVNASSAHKDGVYTNQWFRSQMMDMMLTKIDEATIDIRSPYFIEEMETLERDEFKQSIKAASGEHDDRFMASGFIVFSQHVLDVPGRQYARKRVKYAGTDPTAAGAPVYATYQAGMNARSDLKGRPLAPIQEGRTPYGGTVYSVGRYRNNLLPRGYK